MRTPRSELLKVYTQCVLNLTDFIDAYHLDPSVLNRNALTMYYDQCVKYVKFSPPFSVSNSYQLIQTFKRKIVELERRSLELERRKVYEPKSTIEVKFEGFNVAKGVLNINDQAYVGKNRFANQKVYDHTKNRNYSWYHANVQGGGLVAIQNGAQTVDPAIALIFSKYLSVYHALHGDVSKSDRVEKAPQVGSFYFKSSTTLSLDVRNVNLYYDLKDAVLTISFSDLNSGRLAYRPLNNKRKYDDLNEVVKSHKLALDNKSKAMLDRIVPNGWDLCVTDYIRANK